MEQLYHFLTTRPPKRTPVDAQPRPETLVRSPYGFGSEYERLSREPGFMLGSYDANTCFMPHEKRDFLEHTMPVPWALWTLDDADRADKAIDQGYPGWETFSGTVRSKTNLIMVPEGSGLGDDLRVIGLQTDGSTMAKATSTQKYLKRLFGSYEAASWWTVTSWDGEILVIRHKALSETLRIRIIQGTKHSEGMHLFTQKAWCLLSGESKKSVREGSGRRWTGIGPVFLKGHGLIWNDLAFDAVFYDPKYQISWDRGFFFGSMGGLHTPEVPRMDLQSIINMELYPFLMEWVQKFLQQVMSASLNADELRRTFMRFSWKKDMEWDPEQDEMVADPMKIWPVRWALEHGVSPEIPAIYRRIYKYMLHQVLDTTKGRIPVAGNHSAYVMPDPYCFDKYGDFHPERTRIQGNSVYCPKLKPGQEVLMWRRPNAPREFWIANAVDAPCMQGMGNGDIIFQGPDMQLAAQVAKGGEDNDDANELSQDPRIIAHVRALRSYPKPPKVVSVEPTRRDVSKYVSNPSRFTLVHLHTQITLEKETAPTGLGASVNTGMRDYLLSGDVNKDSMNADLEAQQDAERVLWLIDRLDDQTAAMMNDLEGIIDGFKKNGCANKVYAETVKRLRETDQVWPWVLRNRIPQSRQTEEKMPAIARTPLCHVMEAIEDEIVTFEDACRKQEWLGVRPAPQEIVDFLCAVDQDTMDIVQMEAAEHREWWAKTWTALRESGKLNDPDDAQACYLLMDTDAAARLNKWDPVVQELLWAEQTIYRYHTRFLDAPLDERTGLRQQYPDALVWTHGYAAAGYRVYEKLNLLGQYQAVQLLSHDFDHMDVPVSVESGLLKHHKEVIGLSPKVGDGSYRLRHGVLEIKAASKSVATL